MDNPAGAFACPRRTGRAGFAVLVAAFVSGCGGGDDASTASPAAADAGQPAGIRGTRRGAAKPERRRLPPPPPRRRVRRWPGAGCEGPGLGMGTEQNAQLC